MRINAKEIAFLLEKAPKLSKQRPSRTRVNRLVDTLRLKIRHDIDQHMQPWMVLLDESLRFFIYLERYEYSLKPKASRLAFAHQISRVRSDILGLRELISLGQEGPAHAISRCFLDGIELAMALAEDISFAEAYMDNNDDTEFWKQKIGYVHIYKRVGRFLQKVGETSEQITHYIERHKALKNQLSGHIHNASFSAFRSAAIPSLEYPGMLVVGSLGSLSIHMPNLCYLIADETQRFSAYCINSFVSSTPLPVFSNYRPTKKLNDVLASAHIVQELLLRYSKELAALEESFFKAYALNEEADD